jgi:hypothetical protein
VTTDMNRRQAMGVMGGAALGAAASADRAAI